MRILRTVIAFMVTMLGVPALARPAYAGGRVEPSPDWMGVAFLVAILVALYVSVVAMGIAYRRRRIGSDRSSTLQKAPAGPHVARENIPGPGRTPRHARDTRPNVPSAG
jgi:hypothetical protein